MNLSIYTEDSVCDDAVKIWIVSEDAHGNRSIAKPMQLEFVPHKRGMITDPSLIFVGPVARQFFPAFHDAIIRSGYLKPKKDESIEAIQNHLADMRKIVFEHVLKDKGDGK